MLANSFRLVADLQSACDLSPTQTGYQLRDGAARSVS